MWMRGRRFVVGRCVGDGRELCVGGLCVCLVVVVCVLSRD